MGGGGGGGEERCWARRESDEDVGIEGDGDGENFEGSMREGELAQEHCPFEEEGRHARKGGRAGREREMIGAEIVSCRSRCRGRLKRIRRGVC